MARYADAAWSEAARAALASPGSWLEESGPRSGAGSAREERRPVRRRRVRRHVESQLSRALRLVEWSDRVWLDATAYTSPFDKE